MVAKESAMNIDHQGKNIANSIAMIITLVSFTMLFAVFFLGYAIFRFNAQEWPPMGMDRVGLGIPSLSTLFIVLSSVTLVIMEGSIKKGEKKVAKYVGLLSLILGFSFIRINVIKRKIRIGKDQKIGISYCEDMQENSLSLMVDQALENSKYVKEDEYEEICVAHKDRIFADNEKTYREDNTPAEKKIELCLELEKGIKAKDSSVKSAPYNGYSEGESASYIANSLGTLCFEKNRSFSCYTSALIEKDGKQSMHYHGSVGRVFNELNPSNCIEESFKHANSLLNAGPVATGQYDVIFSPDMLDDLFGVFSTITQNARISRNPKTGEKVNTPEKKTIHFKMSKDLFKKLNNEE